ncbi:hypothetical protein SUGI_1108570 [Cryptomeria japonica]|uniref:laccase-12 n=1 Tax=Cryptomeria japonica TaxID=3369 RepID=UPI002414B010|nr:laccase-12 [Cryptomeria japonica]GLJ52121.1 hypothetical protein SUGI_1108570 [Cryptomeria japonica]
MPSAGDSFSMGRIVFILLFLVIFMISASNPAKTIRRTFIIESTTITKLCHTQNVITVNGQLPGPTLYVNEEDSVIVRVHNRAKYNATIHWHGLQQMRTPWADGPVYITQCPIRPGGSYTYRFIITAREGTLWWHAHSSWLRATVYGAIVIFPKRGASYPFTSPYAHALIQLGEWWNSNPIDVIDEAIRTGGPPNISDAFTINGEPGDLYPCSKRNTYRLPVRKGKRYLLRIVNAAMNFEMFFSVAHHKLTVVGVDASYTKPYKTKYVFIAPGQTTDVLLTANKPIGKYYMAARVYSSSPIVAFDNTTTTAILDYIGSSNSSSPVMPKLPLYNDTRRATRFSRNIRSLGSKAFPVQVPKHLKEDLLFTVGFGLFPCPSGRTCLGPNGTRLAASINNISFVSPSISILQAYYFKINGVFTTDFPSKPPVKFNYTSDNIPSSLYTPLRGTRVKVLEYNTAVQLVFQDTNIFTGENHPMHLHGYNFYVVGFGFGNYDPVKDPLKFNLVNPPKRNTVAVPVSGWAAIRFYADNPGVWFLHCHIDAHLSWGLSMALLVKDGPGKSAKLKPPPSDLPKC